MLDYLPFFSWNTPYHYGHGIWRRSTIGAYQCYGCNCADRSLDNFLRVLDMVNNITSLTGNGLKDWLIQRITAIYFAGYILFLFVYLLYHPHLTYHEWRLLFSC